MAMTMKTEGLTEVSRILTELGSRAGEVAANALYSGAGIVADEFTKAVDRIQTEPFRWKKEKRLPSPEEKEALRGKTGIAKFNKDGSEVETLIGFSGNAGYTMLGNRKTAVREIARSINSGTSFMTKQPVFRKAVSTSKRAAEQAIISTAEQMINEITGEK